MTVKTMHSCDVLSCSQVAEDREHISSEKKCQTIATSNDPRTATVEIEPLKIPLLAPALKNLGKLLVGVLLYDNSCGEISMLGKCIPPSRFNILQIFSDELNFGSSSTHIQLSLVL